MRCLAMEVRSVDRRGALRLGEVTSGRECDGNAKRR